MKLLAVNRAPMSLLVSDEPFFLPEPFGCGIDSAFGERIAPQYPPAAEKDPHDHAVIVDTALRIFRTGGGVEAGVAGKMILIKTDKPYAETLQVRLKHLPPQKFKILRQ